MLAMGSLIASAPSAAAVTASASGVARAVSPTVVVGGAVVAVRVASGLVMGVVIATIGVRMDWGVVMHVVDRLGAMRHVWLRRDRVDRGGIHVDDLVHRMERAGDVHRRV